MIKYVMVLITALLVGFWLWFNPGVVEVHIMDLSLLMPLWVFVVVWVVLTIAIKLIWSVLKLPSWWRHRSHARQDKRAMQQLTKMCLQLSQGQLLGSAKSKIQTDHLPNTLLSMLARLLTGTLTSKDTSEMTLMHEKAEGIIRWIEGVGYAYQGETEKAQDALRLGLVKHPKHPGILTVLAHLYYQDRQWTLLYDLMYQYHRYLPSEVTDLYQEDAYYEYLMTIISQPETFEGVWRRLPREFKQSVHFIDLRIESLQAQKDYKQLKSFIERSLVVDWQDDWVNQYITIPNIDPQKSIKQLLAWLKDVPNNVVLLNALAKAHLQAGLIERAGTYYEAAFNQSAHLTEGLALLAFYQAHQPEKVTQLIPHIVRLV